MKVALVNYEYPGVTTNCGGGGRVTQLLAEQLRDQGHDPLVVTDPSDGSWPTFPARRYRAIKEKLKSSSPDVIHGHFSLPSSLPLPRLSEEYSVPLVVTCMGADVYDPTRFCAIRPLANLANRYIFDRADAVTVPSTDLHYRTVNITETDIIPHGIDTKQWSWRDRSIPDDGPVNIVSVCRLVERKNLHTAIEAVETLREFDIDAEYTIIGTGPLADELREYDHEWLSFPGYVEDLEAALADHHLFFLPSHHEAFGMVFLEALATGLPVVTSSSGGQADIVTQSVGFATRCESPGCYADALARAIDQYDELQAGTEEYVERNYSADRMAERYCDLYDHVTS